MSSPLSNALAFTVHHNGIAREIIIDCGVSLPFDPNVNKGQKEPEIKNTKALWDTGATGSAITQKAANELGLKPIRKALVHTAGGPISQNVYLVNIYLPNKVLINYVTVTECAAVEGKFDLLIGMDIITLGDFSITNVDSKTIVSFRYPSLKTIDYVNEINLQNHTPAVAQKKVGRNDPCPCGSGKKYKYCHGK
jgi:predicted aspartyl protease